MNVRLLAAGLLVWASSFALGADKETEDLLAKMRSVYSGTRTAHVVVKTTNAKLGAKPLTVDMYYMRENKIRASVDGIPSLKGKTYKYTSDGSKTAYSDLSGNIQYASFSIDVPIPINLEAMSFWDWKRQLSTSSGANMEHSRFKIVRDEQWNKKKWTVLEETAYGQNVFVRYFIDPTSSLIHRVLVYDLSRRNLNQETIVTKMDRNIRVDSKMFEIRETRGRLDIKRRINPLTVPLSGHATKDLQGHPRRKASHSDGPVV